MERWFAIAALVLGLLVSGDPAGAQTAARKAGRGLAGMTAAFLEVPGNMVAETRAGALLRGGTNGAPADVGALCRVLEALADLAWTEREWLAELDVNPIVVRERGQGCVVVDALIVPRADAPPAA